VKRRCSFGLQPASDVGPNGSGDRRHSCEPPRGQSFEIKPGSTDENGKAPFPDDFINCGSDIAAPSPNRVVFSRIDKAIEPMFYPLFFFRRWTRRDDAQVAVHLH